MKLLGGGGGGGGRGGVQLVCGRPTLALSSALVPQALSYLVCVWMIPRSKVNHLRDIEIKIKSKVK